MYISTYNTYLQAYENIKNNNIFVSQFIAKGTKHPIHMLFQFERLEMNPILHDAQHQSLGAKDQCARMAPKYFRPHFAVVLA